MVETKKRDPHSEELIRDFLSLIGPGDLDFSDREAQADMAELGVKISHERIRQYRNDEWEAVNAASRRKIRTYMKLKAANSLPSIGEHEQVRGGGHASSR